MDRIWASGGRLADLVDREDVSQVQAKNNVLLSYYVNFNTNCIQIIVIIIHLKKMIMIVIVVNLLCYFSIIQIHTHI